MGVIQQQRAKLLREKQEAAQEKSKVKSTGNASVRQVQSKMEQRLKARKAKKTTEEQLKTLANNVEDLDGKVDDMDCDLGDVKDGVDGLKGDVSDVADQVADVQSEVDNLGERVNRHDDELGELRSRLDGEEGTGNPEMEAAKEVVAKCIEDTRPLEEIAERAPIKAEAVKRLEAFVTKYVESAAAYPNIAAVWFMIWLFDLGDIKRAVEIGLHLAKQGIHKMPTRFSSTIYTYICDNVYDWAKAELEAERSAGPYLQNVVTAMEAQGWEVPVVVRGKIHAMMGKHLDAQGQYKEALDEYETAMGINDRAGVKKRIKALTAMLEKAEFKGSPRDTDNG